MGDLKSGSTVGGHEIIHRGNSGAGSGVDSDLLDGIEGSQFLRSDTSDNYSGGILTVETQGDADVDSLPTSINALQVRQNGTGDALMTFHIAGVVAGHFGLDRVLGDLIWGGWSASAKHRIWHSGNDGSGSGLDSDTVDGCHVETSLSGGSGYVPRSDAVLTADRTNSQFSYTALTDSNSITITGSPIPVYTVVRGSSAAWSIYLPTVTATLTSFITIRISHGSTVSVAPTFYSSSSDGSTAVLWSYGQQPAHSTTTNVAHVYQFYFDRPYNRWFGSMVMSGVPIPT